MYGLVSFTIFNWFLMSKSLHFVVLTYFSFFATGSFEKNGCLGLGIKELLNAGFFILKLMTVCLLNASFWY
jgi:hypothetical protein